MRFTLSSSALNARLQSLAKVINSKNSLPILDSFLFEVSNSGLKITASDSENVMTSLVALSECDGEGASLCPTEQSLTLSKNCPSNHFRSMLTLKRSLSKFSIRTVCTISRHRMPMNILIHRQCPTVQTLSP